VESVAGHLNAQHGRLLDLTIWLIDNPIVWQGDGVWTVALFLGWRCGIGPSTARNLVAAAERAGELPVSIAAVRRGELSLDQLVPIVRKVPAWADAEVASLAKRLTVSQISRTVNRMNWQSTPASVDTTPPDTDTDTGTEGVVADDPEATPEPDSENTSPRAGGTAGDAGEGSQDVNRVWFGVDVVLAHHA
jgi:Domain of unknown function (DUF222)